MASIEFHHGSYRIIFRFGGRKFTRSLNTENGRSANAALARLEENLARLAVGELMLPPGADVATFLLSDGRLEQRPTIRPEIVVGLGELLDLFVAELTPGALEATTEHCIRVHIRHFKREFGEKCLLREIDFQATQAYVDQRAKAQGLHGKKLSALTIKKEISTLNMIWSWAEHRKFVGRPLPKKGLRYPKTADKPPFQTVAEIRRNPTVKLEDDEHIKELVERLDAEIDGFIGSGSSGLRFRPTSGDIEGVLQQAPQNLPLSVIQIAGILLAHRYGSVFLDLRTKKVET